MRRVALSEVKDDLSRYLHLAEKEQIIITRHGKPAGLLIGFESEEDWFDYLLENDPRFIRRMEAARESMRAGRVTHFEDLLAQFQQEGGEGLPAECPSLDDPVPPKRVAGRRR